MTGPNRRKARRIANRVLSALLDDEIDALIDAGYDLDSQVVPALEHARTTGLLPASLDELILFRGGMRPLVDRWLALPRSSLN